MPESAPEGAEGGAAPAARKSSTAKRPDFTKDPRNEKLLAVFEVSTVD